VVVLFAVMTCFVWLSKTIGVIVWCCETCGYVRFCGLLYYDWCVFWLWCFYVCMLVHPSILVALVFNYDDHIL